MRRKQNTVLCPPIRVFSGPNAIAGIFVILATLGCGLLSGKRSTADIPTDRTDVGIPTGPATGKSIGVEGGTISSSDGRLTVRVAPNTISSSTEFSIQPLTNAAAGGFGSAFRLEPSGQKFDVPIELTFKYQEQDLEDTIPEALGVAYQDTSGMWQILRASKVDPVAKTLTVSTLHFTDWSILKQLRLEPAKATVRVGESIEIKLIGCKERPLYWYEKIFGKGRPTRSDGSSWEGCYLGDGIQTLGLDWSVDVGTLGPPQNPVRYTAPAKRPSPNIATVKFPYSTFAMDESTFSKDNWKKGLLLSHITIVDRGYRVGGKSHDLIYSGVVCDLTKPFIVQAAGLANFEINFTPSGPTTGSTNYTMSYRWASEGGKGSYSIEGADTDNPIIVWNVTGAATEKVRGSKHSGNTTIRLGLVPLENTEGWCGG